MQGVLGLGLEGSGGQMKMTTAANWPWSVATLILYGRTPNTLISSDRGVHFLPK